MAASSPHTSDSGLADSDPTRAKEMTAINSGMHEVPGVRLPLQTSYASPSHHAVFMYSTTGGTEGSVTLQLRDTDDLDDKSGLASVLARLQQEDATLSISYQDSEMLTEGSIDVLLGTGSLHTTGNGGNTATFDLFDSESGQDLTLSPQTFTSSTEAFINDNSDSLGVPGDTDTVGSTEDVKGVADSSKLAVKKSRPKASSPNRQGPQQCQVCGKVFGNASALAKHKLTHSDERKYVCSMCGKAFKRQDHLNGHMLTHRNKKPYECKAEGCGKSYCDARSLRRHTENHHTNSSAQAAVTASTSTSGSGSTGSSDDASPLSSSCIQYAPPPQTQQQTPTAPPPPYPATSSPSTTTTTAATATSSSSSSGGNGTKAPSQLQQLLASEPASATSTSTTTSSKASSSAQPVNNDGLTKQQLDLIHQIMQQTQQQAAAHQKHQQNSNSSTKNSVASNSTTSSVKTVTSSNKSRTWAVQSSTVGAGSKTNGVSNGQSQTGGSANTVGSAKQQQSQQQTQQQQQQQQQSQQQDPKPVECNLCHRKFKNIPALNGHMRLHGGYFKKDSESKKCEKKEVSGPPLQTASMSVRALIEEKIIQKRITNPQLQTPLGQQQQQQQQQQSPHQQQTHLTYTSSDTSSGSRVGGAPPQYPNTPPTPGSKEPDLNIKLSSFVVPAPPVQSQTVQQQQQQQQSAGEKMRRHSDSEHFVSPRAPADVQQEAVALAELLLKRSGKDNLPLWLPPLMQSQPQWRALVSRSGDSIWRPGSNKGHDEVAVKRASSDPGAQHGSNSSSASPSPQPTMPTIQQQHLQLNFQGDSYSLAGVTYQATEDGGGYFSPSLQEDMFQQVSVQDTMLLHGVDAAQLAETIQFQAATLLQDQATAEQLQDIASLEDYQTATAGLQDSVQSPQYNTQNHHAVPQDFQAVLDSSLPAGLADFSTYGQPAVVTSNSDIRTTLPSPVSKDPSGGYQTTQSPHQQGFANSPHAALTVQSPLPSPLTHQDSPGFTYPTPPASQEGQSPSFVHGTIMTSTLPLSSPQQQSGTTDSYVQSVISHGDDHVPPASSPLSAAFYTAAMSSSAAVEAALSEVLPVETQGGCVVSSHLRSPHGFSLYGTLANPSPPPQSPLSTTPVPSPLSLSSVPASSSSVSSPLPPVTYAPAQGQVTFPLSPHQSLQSQMMPNSEDPLLSSSPKDFGSRKKFDFGGIHSFKLVGNGMVDFGVGNSGLTGIVVDSNGELKFFQTSNHHPAKSLVMTGSAGANATVMIGSSTSAFQNKKSEPDGGKKGLSGKGTNTHHTSHFHHHHHSSSATRSQRPKLQVALDNFKEDGDDDVFLSPTSIPASPIRVQRKRPRPEPLYIPPHHHPMFQSRLRSSRLCMSSPPPPYTPPPMLSPTRNGQGLFWQAVTPTTAASNTSASSTVAWPSSTTLTHCKNGNGGESSSSDESHQGPAANIDSAPESDATPHMNIGPEFQCSIPQWNPDREKANREPSYEHLLWDPGISKFCTDAEVEMYLEFACCAAVPGGGRNKEYALHLLHMCHGNIHEAMLKLMQPTPTLPPGHPLLAYEYTESDRWSAEEMDTFHQGLLKYDKDFHSLAEEIGSKTMKQCIQFYYLWKKVCPEEYKRLRLIRRRQNADYGTRTDIEYEDIKMDDSRIPANDVELVSTSSESRLFVCEYPDCSASFNSRAALNGHIRIHGGGVCGRSPTPDKRPATATPPTLGDIIEEFPCKICGKVFNKVKSRSAHMKSHRPPDAEPKKAKLDPHKMEAAEQTLGRAMGVSTTIGRHT